MDKHIKMKIYKFEIGQLQDEHLSWIASECRKNVDKSPAFFGVLGNARRCSLFRN